MLRETLGRSCTGARCDDKQGSTSGDGDGKRTDGLEIGTNEETVTNEETITAGAGTHRVAKRQERRISSRGDHQSGTRGGKGGCAERGSPRPIGAQIDAANARLARTLLAEENLKERWLMLKVQVKANQQEKISAQTSLGEFTSKTKMELGRGRVHNHPETALEQILERIETTWPVAQDAPTVIEMVHHARTVMERSRSRSNERSRKRAKNVHEVAGDRYQCEETEHGSTDDLDISIDFQEPVSSPAEDPTERFAKMQRLAKEANVTIARGVRAPVRGGPWHGCQSGSRLLTMSRCSKVGDARQRQTVALVRQAILPKDHGMYEFGFFACRKNSSHKIADTLRRTDCLDDSQMSMQVEGSRVTASGSTDLWEANDREPPMPAAPPPPTAPPPAAPLGTQLLCLFSLTRMQFWKVWMTAVCNTNLSTGLSAELTEFGAKAATRNGATVDASGNAKRVACASARYASRQLRCAGFLRSCARRSARGRTAGPLARLMQLTPPTAVHTPQSLRKRVAQLMARQIRPRHF